MPDQARVTSIEALEGLRASLIVYLEKAGRVLDEISDEVVRTRLWLENDREAFWENQVKRRRFHLEQKEQDLFRARLSTLHNATPMEHAAVREAKRALEEAEHKLVLTRKWSRDYDNRVVVVAKEVEKLRSVLQIDMGKAMTFLTQSIKTLDAYAERAAPAAQPTATGLAGSDTAPSDTASEEEKGES